MDDLTEFFLATMSGGGSSMIPSQYRVRCWDNTDAVASGGPGSHADSWEASASVVLRVFAGHQSHGEEVQLWVAIAEALDADAARPLARVPPLPGLPGELYLHGVVPASTEVDAFCFVDLVPLPLVS